MNNNTIILKKLTSRYGYKTHSKDFPNIDINELDFLELDGEILDELLCQTIITGAEPIDYPLTDGIILYIQDAQKQKAVLMVEQNPDENRFIIKIAMLP